jgi:hypothetical protein
MIVGMFSKDVRDNFVTMVTFCDGGKVLIKAALESSQYFEELKNAKNGLKFYSFNNSAMFVDPASEDIAPEMHDQYWHMGTNSMEKFVNEFLMKVKPAALKSTRVNL